MRNWSRNCLEIGKASVALLYTPGSGTLKAYFSKGLEAGSLQWTVSGWPSPLETLLVLGDACDMTGGLLPDMLFTAMPGVV